MKMKSLIALLSAAVLLTTTTGCVSTAQKVIKKSDLETQTQMSSTIFLDPVGGDKRTVFVQIRNTTDKQVAIADKISQALASKGYKVMNDPDAAHYWIQGNILKVEKSDLDEARSMLSRGYEGVAMGAVIGSQFGGGSGSGAAAITGALVGGIADALWEDILYMMVTDLQISERVKSGVVVTENNKQTLVQGTSGAKTQTSTEESDRKKYQTRIVSTANKVNLKFEEALPELEQGLVRSITGIL